MIHFMWVPNANTPIWSRKAEKVGRRAADC